jgi:hypothetical protein
VSSIRLLQSVLVGLGWTGVTNLAVQEWTGQHHINVVDDPNLYVNIHERMASFNR